MTAAVGEILGRLAAGRPDFPFIKVGTGAWCTYRQLDRASDRVAAGLAEIGVGPGDRVALVCGNRLETVELLFACAKLGAIHTPLNYHLRGEFLRYQLTDCGASTLVTDGPGAAAAAPILGQTSVRRCVALDGSDEADGADASPDGAVPYQRLRASTAALPAAQVRPADILSLIYTSGTTGYPKGCMLSHGYHVNAGASVRPVGWVVPGDRMFTAFPHFHTSFQVNVLMSALVNDASVVQEPAFHASVFMRRAAEEGATMIWGLGTMAMAILAQPPSARDRDNTVRLSAWCPLHPGRQLEFQERFGGVVNSEAYGQTEAVPIVIEPADQPSRLPFVVGRPSELYDVRIVDELDRELPAGQVGEIVVRPRRPDCMFSGYWGKPEASLAAFRNLWHHTGDLGKLDEQQRLTFVDRAKDAVRRRGENVSCFELELAIGQHPMVAQAAATAVPSPLGEDDIKISIICHPGDVPGPAEWFAFFRDQLPYYAIPRYVDIRESFPLTATGRVRKDALRAEGVPGGAWDLERLGLMVPRDQRRLAVDHGAVAVSAEGVAAVDPDGRAGDVGRGVADQEHGRGGQFGVGAGPAQWQRRRHGVERLRPAQHLGAAFGDEGPGGEGVHPDPQRAPFLGQRAGQVLDAGLGRAGVRHPFAVRVGEARGDVEDDPAAALAHGSDDGPRAQERAVEVDVHHCAPAVGAEVGRWADEVPRRAVDQDVDAAERGDHLLHGGGDLLGVPDVAGHGQGLAAGRGDLARAALHVLGPSAQHRDPRPEPGVGAGDRRAQAGAAPGHHGGPAGQQARPEHLQRAGRHSVSSTSASA
jgi:crotonobetaine/carnitine-CoA ligase